MPTLHNHLLLVDINTKGAELQSLINQQTGLQYLWNGNPDVWAKHSPVLFPIVGELKNGSYTYNGKTFHLSRHGFARDAEFFITDKSETSITFTITDTPQTLFLYPFPFSFSIQYTLDENRLYVVYSVTNTGSETMYFSLGGHPAFKVPLVDNTDFEDHYLSFSQIENAERYPLSADGLIEITPVPFFHNAEQLKLKRFFFYEDALVFKHIQSKSISVKSDVTPHGFTFYFEDFPYLGIWNKKDAEFLCIEPWCGIADSVNASGDITQKEGINALQPNEVFERQWSVELF